MLLADGGGGDHQRGTGRFFRHPAHVRRGQAQSRARAARVPQQLWQSDPEIVAADRATIRELQPPFELRAAALHILAYPCALLADVCQTLRNAAELFLAAAAPAGFFGNSFSTFSRGIALLRGERQPSYAYDCAPVVTQLTTPTTRKHCTTRAHWDGTCTRRGPKSTWPVLESAGFRLLKLVDPARCPTRPTRAPRRLNPNSRQQRQESARFEQNAQAQAVLGGEWEYLSVDGGGSIFRPAFVADAADPPGSWHPACYRNRSGGIRPPGRPCSERRAFLSLGVSERGQGAAAHVPAKLPKPNKERRRVRRLTRGAASKV